MKRILFSFLIILAATGSVWAQKTIKDLNAEKREVSSFHGITVTSGIDLVLTQGTTEEVAVSASKTEDRDRITTRVEEGVLKIYYDTKFLEGNKQRQNKKLKAYVSCKTLDKLNVETGAEVEIDGEFESPALELKAHTGGIVNGKIAITSLKISQNTGSIVTLTGKTDKLEVAGNTGSKFMGEDLLASQCTVYVNTGAKIIVSVDKELNANANTGGALRYKGNAGIRNIKTNTGGSVSKI